MAGMEGSTNDISHYIGLLDPWYERNVLGLMKLPMDVLCQVCVCPFPREDLLLPTWDAHGVVSRRFPSPAGWDDSCGWR